MTPCGPECADEEERDGRAWTESQSQLCERVTSSFSRVGASVLARPSAGTIVMETTAVQWAKVRCSKDVQRRWTVYLHNYHLRLGDGPRACLRLPSPEPFHVLDDGVGWRTVNDLAAHQVHQKQGPSWQARQTRSAHVVHNGAAAVDDTLSHTVRG